ncbi:MAG TPA: DUF4180 domain-containing protein [Dehalococcoidia bacterium]|nr:DUF4180 domain-containing protein [Dehalococcoidia bacterium]
MPCLVVGEEWPVIETADGARPLIEEAMSEGARLIAVPADRLGAAFFDLRTGVAGEVLQKMVNYGFQFAVVGDVSSHAAASNAFRDLVVEAGRGRDLFFVTELDALTARLARTHS